MIKKTFTERIYQLHKKWVTVWFKEPLFMPNEIETQDGLYLIEYCLTGKLFVYEDYARLIFVGDDPYEFPLEDIKAISKQLHQSMFESELKKEKLKRKMNIINGGNKSNANGS